MTVVTLTPGCIIQDLCYFSQRAFKNLIYKLTYKTILGLVLYYITFEIRDVTAVREKNRDRYKIRSPFSFYTKKLVSETLYVNGADKCQYVYNQCETRDRQRR